MSSSTLQVIEELKALLVDDQEVALRAQIFECLQDDIFRFWIEIPLIAFVRQIILRALREGAGLRLLIPWVIKLVL